MTHLFSDEANKAKSFRLVRLGISDNFTISARYKNGTAQCWQTGITSQNLAQFRQYLTNCSREHRNFC